ncbi:hypothetical protein HPB50_000428 [Hyalomma asiaticum]|uniref:Uncharacterized protein n=1 Tax=Hyalomma asiaticum TaxID=266040 RepID=A0ACB7RPP3_HYAAI|nr:hypothetical protein HPB50_000428 [Hyalomma asiaticum]
MATTPSSSLLYNSQLYANNDELQREVNLKAVDLLNLAFAPADNTDDQQFLDIGCGTGDFTRDFLLPRCPPCRRLIAVDASEQMLAYARANSTHPKIQYDYLNIGDDITDFIRKYGRFDRVYSFFCLSWPSDQTEALKNVSRLLAPSGECLLVFSAWAAVYAIWRKLAALDRWKKFAHRFPLCSKVFDEFTPKSYDLEDDEARLSYLREILDSAGLTPTTCELLHLNVNVRKDPQAHADCVLSITPVLESLSPEEKELLRKDIANEVLKWSTGESVFSSKPSVYLVHARKRKE